MCECGVKLESGARVPAKATCRACGTEWDRADGDALTLRDAEQH